LHYGQRNRNLAICVGLVAITLLVWARVARNGFINYDDGPYVTENPHVQAGLKLQTFTWAFASIEEANWQINCLAHRASVATHFGLRFRVLTPA